MTADPTDQATPWSQPWTLATPLTFEGVGLHSGRPVTLRLQPAPAGHGYVFHRVDLPGSDAIPARVANVVETRLSTTLAVGAARVQTVEHVLAALWGLGISDARLEIDGPELPVLDGSALPYVEAIRETGVRVLDGRRPMLALPSLGVSDGDKLVAAAPDTACRVTCAVDYGHPLAGPMLYTTELSPAVFAAELAPARTFCLLREVEAMWAAGLAKGGSVENALVIGDDGYTTPPRFADEPARHKALDLIGDLALLGVFWRGHVVASRAGHALHVRWASQLAASAHRAPALAV